MRFFIFVLFLVASGSTSNQIKSPSPTNTSSITFEWADEPESSSKTEEESSTSKQPSKSTSCSEIYLSKGGNAFEFSIIIPSSSPPSERSQYGRVLWTLTSTAFGAGRANTSISDQKPIYPVVNRNPEGKPFHLSLNTSHEMSPIGEISADISSNNLAVAGSLSFNIKSSSPKKGVSIDLVEVMLESNVELETKRKGIDHRQRLGILFSKGYVSSSSMSGSKVVERGRLEDGIVYNDEDAAEGNEKGERGWSVEGSSRLPDENFIRGSSHPGSTTSIEWTHNLLIQIVYSFPYSSSPNPDDPSSKSNPSGLKVFSIRNQIPLQSCCAAHPSVRLPAYQVSDSPTSSSTSLASKEKVKEKNSLVALLPPDTPWVSFPDGSTKQPQIVLILFLSTTYSLLRSPLDF